MLLNPEMVCMRHLHSTPLETASLNHWLDVGEGGGFSSPAVWHATKDVPKMRQRCAKNVPKMCHENPSALMSGRDASSSHPPLVAVGLMTRARADHSIWIRSETLLDRKGSLPQKEFTKYRGPIRSVKSRLTSGFATVLECHDMIHVTATGTQSSKHRQHLAQTHRSTHWSRPRLFSKKQSVDSCALAGYSDFLCYRTWPCPATGLDPPYRSTPATSS